MHNHYVKLQFTDPGFDNFELVTTEQDFEFPLRRSRCGTSLVWADEGLPFAHTTVYSGVSKLETWEIKLMEDTEPLWGRETAAEHDVETAGGKSQANSHRTVVSGIWLIPLAMPVQPVTSTCTTAQAQGSNK